VKPNGIVFSARCAFLCTAKKIVNIRHDLHRREKPIACLLRLSRFERNAWIQRGVRNARGEKTTATRAEVNEISIMLLLLAVAIADICRFLGGFSLLPPRWTAGIALFLPEVIHDSPRTSRDVSVSRRMRAR